MVYPTAPTLMQMHRRKGFTLIELLVVIVIIGMLAAWLIPTVLAGLTAAKRTREISCAKSLMTGVFNYANANRGELLPGYHNQPVEGPDGAPLPFPASARYPWRLMPYIGSQSSSVMWANPDGGNERIRESSSDAYAVSISPSLGMNIFYVGGDDSGNSGQGIRPTAGNIKRFGKFCVTLMSEVHRPSQLLVFAGARMPGEQGNIVPGYFMVQAPNVVGQLWSSAPVTEQSPPAQHGYVDFRYNGHTVVAHLDGHVELLQEKDLRDMRRWSNLAAQADDPDHRLR